MPDPSSSVPPLKITVKLIDQDPDWFIRATAKFLGQDYESYRSIPKEAYIMALPSIMGGLVREVAHQIVVTRVGMKHAQDGHDQRQLRDG